MLKYFYFVLSVFVLAACATATLEEAVPYQDPIVITQIQSPQDQDADGINDFADIVQSARAQIGVVTEYDTSYYAEAYPPGNKGACADIMWRTLDDVGYDFKTMIDKDMANFPNDYRKDPIPDSNINFRRVENIRVFLNKYTEKLILEVIPSDEENLAQWQGGDIVTYAQIPGGLWHIGIVSDQRRPDGVPLLIHNYGRGVREDDYLLSWPTEITGHYRFVLTQS